MKVVKRFFPYLLIIVLLLIVKNNISSIFNSLNNVNVAQNLGKELDAKKKENRYLNERLKYVKTGEFIKDEAQGKLGMLKPGEYFVIAPTPSPLDKSATPEDKPNWKKWLELFF